jgi:hemolysin D
MSDVSPGMRGLHETLWRRCWQAWRQRPQMGDARLDADVHQFLPAALEIQETPPSPKGLRLLSILLALFAIAVLWACLGHVDIVVTAPGRIVPSGYVKSVQAIESGKVSAIHVAEGDRVSAGQALVSFDPTVADADSQRIEQRVAELTLEIQWRRALDGWLAMAEGSIAEDAIARIDEPGDRERASALYAQHRQEITARLVSVEHERDATRAGLAMAGAESDRVEATLPILSDRVAAYQALYDAQFGAKITYLEMLQQRTELEKSLPVLHAREQQLAQQLAALEAQLSFTREEYRTQNLMRLTELASEREVLLQESVKAKQRRQHQVLAAPVTGTVQQLAVHTVGGVVMPAQELMKVVPENAAIEVEALMQNRDIGFVSEGQLAEVKIDAFNFTKYGLIDAEVVNISNDAVEDEQLGRVFKLRLRLAREDIAADGRRVKLGPGMAVTAEIKTGKRRLMEFFLSPLLRYQQESVRER